MPLFAAALGGSGGCGGTSAKVLETVDAAIPPSSNLRVDVFLVRSVGTCAVGNPCTRVDLSECFYVADRAGRTVRFDPTGLAFVRPGDPRTQTAAQVQCFRLTLDDAQVATAGQLLAQLRTDVFAHSGGDINLEIRTHEVPTLTAPFDVFDLGPFLDPRGLEAVGLPLVSRDTDFVYAISGFEDGEAGLTPRIVHCAGTNGTSQGLFGASTYTWLALSPQCARPLAFLGTWLLQVFVSRRDVGAVPDLYRGNYPACGTGAADPTAWFPRSDDCTTDPDWSGCGQRTCPDRRAYMAHVLARHWNRGVPFNGNHCSDGVMNNPRETGVDTGGVCDQIGR